jgi:prepilin-type N-terminal cleavage/methylation domain-containing protein
MRARNGFTIVELLIALVLFLIVSAATFQLLNNTQRVSRAQSERTEMQSNMRAGALIVPAELRSIGYDRFVTGTGNPAGTIMSDILGMAADSIAFRAVRSSGIICATPAANTYVLDTGWFYTGYRAIAAGRDTLMVYGEQNPNLSADDIWFRKRITAVGAGNCAAAYGGGRAGTAITTDDAVPGDSIVVGAVFHSFEVMSYKLMQGADGRWYLNARSMSNPGDAYQPMLGPLAPNGFRLDYFDVNGNVTAVPANVRTIQVTMISQSGSRTSDMGSSNQQIQTDSVVTRVALRNAMR